MGGIPITDAAVGPAPPRPARFPAVVAATLWLAAVVLLAVVLRNAGWWIALMWAAAGAS